jgi:hypothetical protein
MGSVRNHSNVLYLQANLHRRTQWEYYMCDDLMVIPFTFGAAGHKLNINGTADPPVCSD